MPNLRIFPQNTVLVVDDVEINVNLLNRVLKTLKVTTMNAYGGAEALTILEQHDIDLVLLDINMPDVDGYTVLSQIRETHDLQTLPVILISALTSDEHMIEGFDLGANDYITKPFSNKIVRQRVQTQLLMRQMAHENKNALVAAQSADALKTQLMQIVSHDLKNPLHNLLMMFEMFGDDGAMPGEFVNMAERTTNKMLNIVTDFLDSGLLRDGQLQMDLVPVDIEVLVHDVASSFSQSALKKGVSLQLNIEPCKVLADEKRFVQVLTNLISNAIKYTYPDTVVRIYGEVGRDGYRIDVYDRGDGVPMEEIDRLFQPFSKLSTRPTAGEDSNGLGLYIVKQMAEAQGGKVGLDTAYPDGADFWVLMPLA